MKLVAEDGSIVHGRTLEFATDLITSFAIIPRNHSFDGTTPVGKGLSYTSRYAVVGAILFNNIAVADGINEKGLAAGAFYFPGYARYAEITSRNQSKAVSSMEFVNWILTQFANIDEVKAGLPNVVIGPGLAKGFGDTAPPFHYIVYDPGGKSLVIEPLGDKFVVYDNPLGVLTNSRRFDWHMTNLRNFIHLKPMNVSPISIDGVVLEPFGQGSGMVGMPGDFTPPSRFVRATIFSSSAIPSKTSEQSVLQLFHILNNFDIPLGITRQIENGKIHEDYTLVTCVRDPQTLKFYFKTYEDQTIRMIDLNQFDWDAKAIKFTMPVSRQTYVDISSQFK